MNIIQKLGMVVASLLSFLSASAYDFKSGGLYYDIISLENLTCSVTKGEFKYHGDITIPSEVLFEGKTLSVTSINGPIYKDGFVIDHDGAFFECSDLTSVTIPNSVTAIGESAFKGCSGLTSITIPNSVTAIGESAFKGCSGLTSITIPNSVTKIGYSAFYNCTGLTSVTISNSVTEIGEETFKGCSGLTSVVIPNSVTEIGESAFAYCTSLTSVSIPNSVTCLNGFNGCTGLTSVTIPNSVTKIGKSTFMGCTSLTSVVIPNSVTEIRTSSNSNIEDGAFKNCTSLTSVEISNSIKKINRHTFSGCTSLASVTIPNSVTEIGESAFGGCTGLTSVSIPSSVTCLNGFNGCTGLASVTIPNSVTEIGYRAFECCTGLTSVTIPNSVTYIGPSAFEGCTSLASVSISNSVTYIWKGTFCNCTSLASVVIPNSVTEIGDGAFNGCTGLTSLELPPSLKTIRTIKEYDPYLGEINYPCFYGCDNIKKLTILGDENGSDLTFIQKYNGVGEPFGNLNLEELYLGRVVNTDSYLRSPNFSSLKKITFGKYLKEVGTGDVYCALGSIPTTAEIYCENPMPPSISGDGFTQSQYNSNVVYVPRESLDIYKHAKGWRYFWDIRAYDSESGIEDASADNVSADVFKVYNLAGMLVKETTDKTDAFNLPAGIYIINGRKVAIR